ncbi:MAG: hypothetical protein K0Q95_562 [Bacteroidota bacterium]|jgi:hypothetical protein|nr:hypothetical protein [Bacteroidota bacterium]
MKRLILVSFLFLSANIIYAQGPTTSELYDFNKSRNKKTSVGLKVLGGWALANIGVSAALYSGSKGTDRHFHEMNMIFNGVNVIIVAASLLPKEKNELDLNKTLQWQSNTESTYIANAALDLVYSSVGLYLTERAKNDIKQHDKFKGWGNSLILQGGFLFLFDTSMYVIHKKNGKKLYKMMDKINIGTSGLGFNAVIRF